MFHSARWDYAYTGGSNENPVLDKLAESKPEQPKVEIINTLPKYYAKMYQQHIEVIEQSLSPTLAALGKHLDNNEQIRTNLKDLVDYLRKLITKSQAAENLNLNAEEDAGEI
jgi:hypothetical protein|nr:hypothetical protein [Planctomycetota bacterium]